MTRGIACSRRTFLAGAAAAAPAAARAWGWPFSGGTPELDDHLTLLLADLHVNGAANASQRYQLPRLPRLIDQILAQRVLPRRALVLGDIAWDRGAAADYAASAAQLQRLAAAGITLAFAPGNHDHRAALAAAWPAQAAATRVPGCFVTVVSAPDCDFLLLDTLNEKGNDEKSANPVYGALPMAEQEWLASELPAWPRPVFVCAHHPLGEPCRGGYAQLTVCGTPLKTFFARVPQLAGYIHGHNHRWMHTFVISDWSSRRIFQEMILPSTGHWGDIGYVLMRTSPGEAVAELHQDDFYFPADLPPERRGADWSAMVAANHGAKCHFVWKKQP